MLFQKKIVSKNQWPWQSLIWDCPESFSLAIFLLLTMTVALTDLDSLVDNKQTHGSLCISSQANLWGWGWLTCIWCWNACWFLESADWGCCIAAGWCAVDCSKLTTASSVSSDFKCRLVKSGLLASSSYSMIESIGDGLQLRKKLRNLANIFMCSVTSNRMGTFIQGVPQQAG